MQVDFHRNFLKQFKKLSPKLRAAFERRLRIFVKNPYAVELNNHGLSGEWAGYRTINISGDVRAIYEPVDGQTAFFIEIGTHHQIYGS